MISVRVNEILKYLSSDKKERLKRCVQMESSQKLDNSRTHRNNLANSLSSLSSSSASVDVEAGPPEWLLGGAGPCQVPTTPSPVERANDEQLRAVEIFPKSTGDNEVPRDYKKRRPLTVLKGGHNVQCFPNRCSSSPTSEASLSLSQNSPFIPTDLLSRDVKHLNGYKCVVSAKCDTKKYPCPAASKGQLELYAESGIRDTISHEETSVAGIVTKGKSTLIENQKQSKQKTGSSSVLSEDAMVPAEMLTVTKEPPLMQNKRLSVAETIDHQLPASIASSSPSFVSSRRTRKQKKQKDGANCKISEHIGGPSHEGLNELPDDSSSHLGTFKNKKSARTLRHSVEEHLQGRTSTKEKDSKLDPSIKNCVWLGGYGSASGVAELDTFEVTSIRNQKLAEKRVLVDKCITDHSQVPSSNRVNALDTFDDPVARPVVACRSSDVSSSLQQQQQRDVTEKWIQVHRKVRRVMVPSSVVSHILGSKGSKLEAICQVTRAHIELEKTGNPGETSFVLRGTLEQMQAASNMISALMKDSKSSLDSPKSETIQQVKTASSLHLTPQPVITAKDFKISLKLGALPSRSGTNNAIPPEKSTPQPPQVNGFGPNDEEYPDSIQSSASEQSDPCSERCSPAQDLLIGEYSLFEHGIGQPLERLLARKDSSKQTFARAAGFQMPSCTLTPIIPNRSTIDQLLLAKAPGYRNAKAMYGRDVCFAKAADLGSHMPTGRYGWPIAISGQGLEHAKENDPSSHSMASQVFTFDSSNAHIPPPLERPLSAPGFPSAHSSSYLAAARNHCVAAPAHLFTFQTFSNLNPNAPDFVFTLPLEEASGNRIGDPSSFEPRGSRLVRSPVDPTADDDSGCLNADGSAGGEFSYSHPPRLDFSDPCQEGSVGQDRGFTLPGSAVDDAMYVSPLGGDSLTTQWLCSPEPWPSSKMSYGGMGRGEQVLPDTTAIASYPSRGELYRNYFAHPPFSPITSSPYNCAFYQQQQQNMMLAPVQSWSHTTQTVAHAGP